MYTYIPCETVPLLDDRKSANIGGQSNKHWIDLICMIPEVVIPEHK
jgi:hypothetical protein